MERKGYTQRGNEPEEAATVLGQSISEMRSDSSRVVKPTEITIIDTEQPTAFAGAGASNASEDETQCEDSVARCVDHAPSIKRMLTGEIVPITKSGFILGRKEDRADYVITHNPAISRTHAEIRIRNGKYYVYDLGAKNRTYVNGKLLSTKGEATLADGDVIKLANEDFLIRL